MRRARLPWLLCLTLPLTALPVRAQSEPVDAAAVEVLRTHGLEKSQVMDLLSWICDVHGPRLTGSPNLRRAQDWARQTFEEWGLANAHFEEWGPFGRGWQLDHVSMEAVGENPWPVLAWPKAWSPSLPPVEAEIVLAREMNAEALRALDLADKIVLFDEPREVSEPFDGTARRFDAEALLAMANGSREPRGSARQRRSRAANLPSGFAKSGEIRKVLAENPPLAVLDRGYKGDYGTLFVSSASATTADGERARPWQEDVRVVPQFTLSVEHYNRLYRLAKKGLPVRLAIDLKTTYVDGDPMERNVIAEIPGTDPELRDEVVMIGAHFDSWHSGTGATDNGCGSAVMMEAMRLLTRVVEESGLGPRRTIRIGLWSGEEQGLYGSRAYVTDHFAVPGGRGEPPKELKPEWHKLAGYYNLDNGTGKVRGIYLQGNQACDPIFRAWLRPFHDIDAATVTANNTGGTDHLAFDRIGLPGFQFIQDPVAYSTRTHHSNMDVWDHAVAEDLQQAATVIASFAWHTAQRDEKLPRKPLPEPKPEPEPAVEASVKTGG